jgi:hypothetical protein
MIQDNEDEDGNLMIDHRLPVDSTMTDQELEDHRTQWDTEIARIRVRRGDISPGTSPTKGDSWMSHSLKHLLQLTHRRPRLKRL